MVFKKGQKAWNKGLTKEDARVVKYYCKEDNNPLNLITLCHFCNISVNTSREQWTKFFQMKHG